MIVTLPVTILIEGLVVYVYAAWSRKPVGRLLLASFFANLMTQPILWFSLVIFFRHYMAALIIAEVLIWLAESLLMRRLSGIRLDWKITLVLSFCMNAASAGFGFWLPV